MDCQATTVKSHSPDILSSGSDENEEDKDVPKIKLKFSNAGGQSSSPNPMARVCEYCGKEFSSGKALGGHIRIHTQALKKQGILKLQPESRIEENNNLDKEAIDEQMCPICSRVFPSVKSLFGHMRFHPERRSSLASSSSRDEKEELVTSIDLLKDLPNWSRTDKRGRGSTCEAARNLISLSSAGSSGRISETLAESTWRMKKKKHNINGSRDIIDRKGKALVLSSSNSSSKDDHNGPSSCRRKKFRFMCSTCGMVFPTFQALGGHRSSHNKDKRVVVVSPPPRSRRDNKYRTYSVSASTEAPAGDGPHRCDICRKNFPTGQALGGHKRRHWVVNITGSGSNGKNDELDPDDEASEVGPDPGSRQDPMDIDLNKLPLMDVDEDTLATTS